jgi:hypothetical protein
MSKKVKWQKRAFHIEDLSLWDENARFPQEYFNKSEKELLAYFLKKKEFKIEDLAKEVVNEFDLPQLERIVVLELNGKNIVLEGNRRLTVYKLLLDPSLSTDSKLRNVFEELKAKSTITDKFRLEANVTQSKEDGLRYVDRKHNKGNNEISWGEAERRHFAVRRSNGNSKDVLRVELANAVKRLALPDAMKEEVLGKGYVTTFYRIVDSTPAREKLGYTIQEDGRLQIKDQKIFDDLMKVMVFQIWNKKAFDDTPVDSRSLNKAGDIEAYVKKLKPKDSTQVDKEIKASTKEDLFGEKVVTKSAGGKSRPLSSSRKYLINTILTIENRRINDIYNELRTKLEVDHVPNAVAVLFRVFLECSADYYIEKNKIQVSEQTKLYDKLNKVANDLKKRKLADDKDLKSIRRVAQKDNKSFLSVTTFHDFVHDHKTSPIPTELKTYWDNIENFFQILWKSFSK